jgi:sugar phosphate isomerase/epimerase
VSTPRFSISGATLPHLTFTEQLDVVHAGGAEGIGIFEHTLGGGGAENLARFRASGLAATVCFTHAQAILPLPHYPDAGAPDPSKRVAELCDGIHRLAPFEPAMCVVSTGPQGTLEKTKAWDLVVKGTKKVARAAADVGVTVAVESLHRSIGPEWSILSTIPDMVALLDAVDEPNTGMLFDFWHLWDTPDVVEHIHANGGRFIAVHVDDWPKAGPRSWCDRVLPGDGVADIRGILGAFDAIGFDGWFDLEILSDDGSFGNDFPDSLWKRDPLELVRAGRAQFMREWENRSRQEVS